MYEQKKETFSEHFTPVSVGGMDPLEELTIYSINKQETVPCVFSVAIDQAVLSFIAYVDGTWVIVESNESNNYLKQSI